MFEAIDAVVDEMRELEGEQIFTLRRRLQEAQNDFLKQGERIPITNKFKINCKECGSEQLAEEHYYLHLRQKHQYADEDAVEESNRPRIEYESGLQDLNNLLREYTEVQLEDN